MLERFELSPFNLGWSRLGAGKPSFWKCTATIALTECLELFSLGKSTLSVSAETPQLPRRCLCQWP